MAKFFVYIHHLCGNTHEIKEFDTEGACDAFVFKWVGSEYERESNVIRIFYGDEFTWTPRDIVKSVRLVDLQTSEAK